jgi:hypothetical protein
VAFAEHAFDPLCRVLSDGLLAIRNDRLTSIVLPGLQRQSAAGELRSLTKRAFNVEASRHDAEVIFGPEANSGVFPSKAVG